MSDAPERIWAWAWEVDRHRGQWIEVQEIVGEGLEYVRADLHAAAIARAERAEAALAMAEEALRFLSSARPRIDISADDFLAEFVRPTARAAIAKIAALKGGDA